MPLNKSNLGQPLSDNNNKIIACDNIIHKDSLGG